MTNPKPPTGAGEQAPNQTAPEIDASHRQRALRLLLDTGLSQSAITHSHLMAAYQAILTKELLFAVNELLAYKQAEFRR